ncbi:MAG: hypothetical protein O2780_11930 [Proteobacteria bacterium]|nr:hypothetical protein [Pseudomonadota bacterium]
MKIYLLCITVGLLLTMNIHASEGPVMHLFPTTVLEDIRETGKVAEEMENNLQDIISRLDLQQELYHGSRCAGADEDPGCQRIARQIGATYLEMLTVMTERLPQMELAVDNTRAGLKKRLRSELGEKTTPGGLQDVLLGRQTGPADEATLALRGRSGIRLSDRFKQYYGLVASRQGGASSSLAVIASDIYLDMEQASYLIAATREEISRATLMEQLNQSFGLITPEMAQVVEGVKSILFGEQGDAPIASAPPENTGLTYVSPLEY